VAVTQRPSEKQLQAGSIRPVKRVERPRISPADPFPKFTVLNQFWSPYCYSGLELKRFIPLSHFLAGIPQDSLADSPIGSKPESVVIGQHNTELRFLNVTRKNSPFVFINALYPMFYNHLDATKGF